MDNQKIIDKYIEKLALEFCLTCPNCDRKIPNLQFRYKKGCLWCIPEDKND